MEGDDDWNKNHLLILAELTRASAERATITKDLILVRIEVAKLKTQASIWGAAAGIAAGIMTAIISSLIGS